MRVDEKTEAKNGKIANGCGQLHDILMEELNEEGDEVKVKLVNREDAWFFVSSYRIKKVKK
ncbi:MAG: hypothetical protein ACOC55_01905 [Candidatus Natronoplasma sp.]